MFNSQRMYCPFTIGMMEPNSTTTKRAVSLSVGKSTVVSKAEDSNASQFVSYEQKWAAKSY